MTSRVNRELTDEEINEVGRIYHAWRGEKNAGNYEDKSGLCKSVKFSEIEKNGWVLTPGRYVGAEEVADDEFSYEEKMLSLTKSLKEQFEKSLSLENQIKENLKSIGFDI